jgi:hypothetical protein
MDDIMENNNQDLCEEYDDEDSSLILAPHILPQPAQN